MLLIYRAEELKPFTWEVYNCSYWVTREKADAALELMKKHGSSKNHYKVLEVNVFHTLQEQKDAQPFW